MSNGHNAAGAHAVLTRIELARQRMHAGRYSEAIGFCDEVLAHDGLCVDALRIGGVARLMLKQFGEAASMLQRAAKQRPDDPALLNNLGMALECSGAAAEAVNVLRDAAVRHPARRDILLNLATALQRNYEFAEAAEICERLVSRNGRDAEALCNLASIQTEAGRGDLAIACYERALALEPHLRKARENLAYALLRTGDFERGWPAYESRRFDDRSGISAQRPRWNGESAISLTLIADQGFGDAIQFVRYGALLRAANFSASLQCAPRMVRLLSSCEHFRAVAPFGSEAISAETRWLPLLSLPLALRTRLETIPARVPYLRADSAHVAAWRERLQGDSSFRVGIAWQGNPGAEVMGLRDRSIPLAQFAPLAEIPGVRLYCLQKSPGLEQLRDVHFASRICVASPELDSGEDAFLDTAALMTLLDLVITPDTSIAHLAGALGRPTWVALKSVPDWRWLLHRSDSPWYPTMRLFRQPAAREWTPVFAAMARTLQELLATRAR
ncbi:MAG TPA: tetratricopeptide repeat protein [Steroidobacteraceae bacterium]|nr:tetratricopeptide repeat protein [Steroidobacteraceae bacterium]